MSSYLHQSSSRSSVSSPVARFRSGKPRTDVEPLLFEDSVVRTPAVEGGATLGGEPEQSLVEVVKER
jgi:hypothetical protein